MLKVGDYVTRIKYGNDILFKIVSIKGNVALLKGVELRLVADSNIRDLKKTICLNKTAIRRNEIKKELDAFYIPGVVLHIDSDKEYLEKCIKYYYNNKIKVYYEVSDESNYKNIIRPLVERYNPNIVVITGHDAHYSKRKEGKEYKNSEYFIETVNIIKDKDIIIFAGACQSDYESLIRAGATFASSPKRINIHALDPAIIATNIALCLNTDIVDVKKIVSKTKYKEDGIGGLYIKGTMVCGYPRGRI